MKEKEEAFRIPSSYKLEEGEHIDQAVMTLSETQLALLLCDPSTVSVSLDSGLSIRSPEACESVIAIRVFGCRVETDTGISR